MTHVSIPTTLLQLVARSRKLGADRSICNWGGGNTSAKADEVDFRGRPARILWVKGSGSDLATVTEASFTGLFLEDVLPLLERERMSDSEMVNYLAHCFYEPGRPRPSIETLLHGFLPFPHIDHTHADATNYFACAAGGEELARGWFGDALSWIPYRRPGFGLARAVALALRAKPEAGLVILAKHGLITWGDTDEACYASTLSTIAQARDFVEERIASSHRAVFGGFGYTPLSAGERRTIAAQVAPVLRGLVSAEKRQVLRFEDGQDVLTFASSQDAPRLTKIGAACPDHLVHTKPWPLLVDWTPQQDIAALTEALRTGIAAYVAHYQRYLEANAQQNLDPDAATPVYRESDALADPHPRVILIHSVGMFTTGKDATMADVSAQLYHRAIAVMRGAEACGGFHPPHQPQRFPLAYPAPAPQKLQLAPPHPQLGPHLRLGARTVRCAISPAR